MAVKSKKNSEGTCFTDRTITCSVQDLQQLFGQAQWGNNSGMDKTNFDWICQTDDGKVFTIYDWKYYRPLSLTEPVKWHIGAHAGSVAMRAKNELVSMLELLK